MKLREISQKYVRQIPGEPLRRWFFGDYFDLLVWEADGGKIVGFQLCYDVFNDQRAVTWKEKLGFVHSSIDDGENRPGRYKATPILVPDGIFDYQAVAEKFHNESTEIDSGIAVFVYNKLKEYLSS